jgi:hypothetical protein
MKKIIHDLALQTGGSHYPGVGGELLEKFAELMLKECIRVVENTPTHCAYTTHDLSTVECTIRKSVEELKKHFNT